MAKPLGFKRRGSEEEQPFDMIPNSMPNDDFDGGFDDFDSDLSDDFGVDAPMPSSGGFKRRAAQQGGMPPSVPDVAPPNAPRSRRPRPAFTPPSEPASEPVPLQQPVVEEFVVKPSPAPKSSPEEVVSVEGKNSLFGQLKGKVSTIVSGSSPDDGIEYYTPPEGFSSSRVRYKTRNHRPMPVWIKTVLLGIGILFAIFVLVKTIFYGMMIGRVDFVDSSSHVPVRLTLDEAAEMQAQLSEKVENDITLPTVTPQTNKDIQIILLAGTDNAIGSGDAGECDSLLLVAIDHVHNKIKLVSIARELYAQIPEYKNNMIGEAFFYDSGSGSRSLDVLRETVELNLCVEIDNIVSIDYDALQVIVNKLGGITMNITDEEAAYMRSDPFYGFFPRYTAGGLYTLTGNEMLNYLRMLDIGERNDFERTQRLRNVMNIVFEQVGGLSPVKRAAAVYSVLPYITTDMSSYEVYKLVGHLGRLSRYEMHGMSLPVNGSWDYDNVVINGRKTEVVVANYSFNAEYLQKFIYGDDLTYTYGNSVTGVDVPYVSEEAKEAALAAKNAENQ